MPDKNALSLDAMQPKQTNETHYIKNKALQSPVNRYKVISWHSRQTNNNNIFNKLELYLGTGARRKDFEKPTPVELFVFIELLEQRTQQHMPAQR